ncbi:hypothetical protein [Bacillus smithii]|uniref:hypothetical protein n=1 Tax=Bacillus smithii TaxID=1479 RepID=UPI003D1D89B7
MFYFEEERAKREKILVSCNNNGCDGIFTLIRDPMDFSPRVHGECSKCGRFMSVKLSSIENKRIVSREWI